jgi:hypothetical protein
MLTELLITQGGYVASQNAEHWRILDDRTIGQSGTARKEDTFIAAPGRWTIDAENGFTAAI